MNDQRINESVVFRKIEINLFLVNAHLVITIIFMNFDEHLELAGIYRIRRQGKLKNNNINRKSLTMYKYCLIDNLNPALSVYNE